VDNWQNPSSQYKKGKESKKLINESRQLIASMINASSASELIFVSGGTEANNLVFHSVIQHYNECKRIAENKNLKINQLPHIIISKIEHDSVKLIADKFKKDGIAGNYNLYFYIIIMKLF
jgi:cysteine sulfinate desulfinase/cysteine desulfurase-like protein